MGCCLSKKESQCSTPSRISLINGGPCSANSIDPNRVAVRPMKSNPLSPKNPEVKDEKSPMEKEEKGGEITENGKMMEEEVVINHRKSHERSKTTDPEDSPASKTEEKSTDSNSSLNPAAVVRTSSCTKEEVDAILLQCGRLSRSNSSAAKTRRYSGSKRSFDFDCGGDAAEEADMDGGNAGENSEERRIDRQRRRGSASPRERRRRTPSRERDDTKGYRSGSKERGNGSGGGSRRVSRSPGRRSEINTNPNSNAGGVSGSSVMSRNSRPGKIVSVPATDKSKNNGEPSIERATMKRNLGVASPRSQSPARSAAAGNGAPAPSLSRSSSRKAEQSPHKKNPLGEIDSNKMGPSNGNFNKNTMNRDKESSNFVGQKSNSMTNNRIANQPPNHQSARRRSRSRQSRDFDSIGEELQSNNNNGASSYTALLLEDIQNFHQKSSLVVEAVVADLNSTTETTSPVQCQRDVFNFKSRTITKADLMEPNFENYVTVKRGGSVEEMEEQESSGSNSFTGSSCLKQRQGLSSSSWEPNSADSTDRSCSKANMKERDWSPLGFERNDMNLQKQEFDPLKKGRRVGVDSSSSSRKRALQTTTTTRAAAVGTM